jgi:hypothetical protein
LPRDHNIFWVFLLKLHNFFVLKIFGIFHQKSSHLCTFLEFSVCIVCSSSSMRGSDCCHSLVPGAQLNSFRKSQLKWQEFNLSLFPPTPFSSVSQGTVSRTFISGEVARKTFPCSNNLGKCCKPVCLLRIISASRCRKTLKSHAGKKPADLCLNEGFPKYT